MAWSHLTNFQRKTLFHPTNPPTTLPFKKRPLISILCSPSELSRRQRYSDSNLTATFSNLLLAMWSLGKQRFSIKTNQHLYATFSNYFYKPVTSINQKALFELLKSHENAELHYADSYSFFSCPGWNETIPQVFMLRNNGKPFI